jgi:hypothetical protein
VFIFNINQRADPFLQYQDAGARTNSTLIATNFNGVSEPLSRAAGIYQNKTWVVFRQQTQFNTKLSQNYIDVPVIENFFQYIKGILAALISYPHFNHGITVPQNAVNQYVVGANLYLAGLREVYDNYPNYFDTGIPNVPPVGTVNLTAFDGLGRFGFNEVPILNYIKNSMPSIKVLTNQGSQNFFPNATRNQNSSVLLIESAVDRNSPDSDKISFADPIVLAITEFNMYPLKKKVILELLENPNAFPGQLIIEFNDEETDDPFVRIGNISDLVPTQIRKRIRRIEKKVLNANDPLNHILCHPAIVKVYREITFVPTDGCITLETFFQGNLLHPSIILIPMPVPPA